MALQLVDRIQWPDHGAVNGMTEDPEDSVKAEKVSVFKSWLSSQGGYLHPQVEFTAGIFLRRTTTHLLSLTTYFRLRDASVVGVQYCRKSHDPCGHINRVLSFLTGHHSHTSTTSVNSGLTTTFSL